MNMDTWWMFKLMVLSQDIDTFGGKMKAIEHAKKIDVQQ